MKLWRYSYESSEWIKLSDLDEGQEPKIVLRRMQEDFPGDTYKLSRSKPKSAPKLGKMTRRKGVVKQNPPRAVTLVAEKGMKVARRKNPVVTSREVVQRPRAVDMQFVVRAQNRPVAMATTADNASAFARAYAHRHPSATVRVTRKT